MTQRNDDNQVFKALANETRRAILDALKPGPKTTGALSELLPTLDRTTVMQHLSVLTDAGLVIPERRGRERWNHLNALPIHAIHERWIGPYAAHAAATMATLEHELTGDAERTNS